MILNCNGFFGSEDIELTAGTLDEDAEYVFTKGHCHSFALALAQATGMRLAGLAWYETEWCEELHDLAVERGLTLDEYPDEYPDHVVCLDDRGRAWDITGLIDPESRWDLDGLAEIDAAFARELGELGLYRQPEEAAAATFVPAWLSKYGQEACGLTAPLHDLTTPAKEALAA